MVNLRTQGPYDSPVVPAVGARSVYKTKSTLTVPLPSLANHATGVQLAVQRHTLDSGNGTVTFNTAAGDTLADGRTTFTLVNPGDLYLLEVAAQSGARFWDVVDMQTSSRVIPDASSYLTVRSTPPSDAERALGVVAYVDSSVVPPVLKGWDGTTWRTQAAVYG